MSLLVWFMLRGGPVSPIVLPFLPLPSHLSHSLSLALSLSLQIWEYTTKNPVMTFDLHVPVADVAWAPYKSTVFACVSGDGWLRLFDLAVNKAEPIGDFRPSSSNAVRLTHVGFNPQEPVIAISDTNGSTYVLKLTAAMRQMTAAKIEDLDPIVEQSNLEKLLIVQDEFGRNKTTRTIPPKFAQKKLEEKLAAEKRAAELAAAKKAEQEAED